MFKLGLKVLNIFRREYGRKYQSEAIRNGNGGGGFFCLVGFCCCCCCCFVVVVFSRIIDK